MLRSIVLHPAIVIPAACLWLALFAGCGSQPQQPTAPDSSPAAVPQQDGMTASDIMQKMVAAYRDADVYLDNAEYGEHFVLAGDGVQRQGPPITVSILFERPNLFRITRIEPRADGEAEAAVVVCDGMRLEAMASRFEPQRLSLPAPEQATLETVAPDPLLRKALYPIPAQDMFPQLALLLASNDETPWPLAAEESLVLLPAKDIEWAGSPSRPCYRVQMATTMGPQICWVDKATFLLLRIELPAEQLRKQVYPNHEFTSFSWRFDFYDATVDAQIPDEMFRLATADEDTEVDLVSEFQEPPSETAGDSDSTAEAE